MRYRPWRPGPNSLETSSESTAAIPAATRPSPSDRARNAIATGSAANDTTPTTLSAPALDSAPRVTPRTAAIDQATPGPLNRNSWYPR